MISLESYQKKYSEICVKSKIYDGWAIKDKNKKYCRGQKDSREGRTFALHVTNQGPTPLDPKTPRVIAECKASKKPWAPTTWAPLQKTKY